MTKPSKRTYRLRNWSQYEAALKQRGSLSFWVSEEAIDQWTHQEKTGRRGASPVYTDTAIATVATIQSLFNLAGRQVEGLVESLFKLMKLALPVPDHTTLSRRLRKLKLDIPVVYSQKARHIVVDSTGLKVYGEGEWKVRQHGWCKRRTWRKLHLGVNEQSREIVAAVFSSNDVGDSEVFDDLLEGVNGEIKQVSADGSYDTRSVYQTILEHTGKAAIPPRKNARIWQHGNRKAPPLARDENLRRIRQVGRKRWKEESGYHRRSIAETTVFRLKTIFGGQLRRRHIDNQARETFLQCAALNRMTHLGMPDSYLVEV